MRARRLPLRVASQQRARDAAGVDGALAAVRHGGGANHRYGLGDAILIKDNHIAAAGGIAAVLSACKAARSHMMRVEIEVDRLDQLAEVLAIGGDYEVMARYE